MYYIAGTHGYMVSNFRVWFRQMAWLSNSKGNGKAEDMTVYYALWIGSTKLTPVAGMV